MSTVSYQLLALSFLLCSFQVCFATPFKLSEESLVREASDAPETDRIELEFLDSEIGFRETADDYLLSFDGELREEKSNEEPVNDLSFITERRSFSSFGINQPLPYGVQLGAGLVSEKSRAIGFGDYTAQSRLVGRLSVDLLRDFMGRRSLSELKDAELGVDAAELSKRINQKNFRLRLRRLYWDYLAAYESKKISVEMLKSDRKELALSREKLKVDAADEGDVARLASQVSERTAQRLSFEATMKQIELQLRELLPQLKGRSFSMGSYNKKEIIEQFYSCLDRIGEESETPLQYSFFDELVELKRKQFQFRKRSIDAFADVDLKLDAELGLVGSDTDRGGAIEDISDDTDAFGAIGLQFSVPLDSKRRNTEEAQLRSNARRFRAESRELIAQLDSLHETIVDAITLIRGVIENRISNTAKLSIALKDSQEKYRQARITSQQLLDEQDRYFSNELSLISTQRDLVQLMLDYFAFFTEFPCALNNPALMEASA